MSVNQSSSANTHYTRCPQCKTAFKVTDKLLAMAKGKVRCGACLAVFQADEYFVKPKADGKFAPHSAANTTPPNQQTSDSVTNESTQQEEQNETLTNETANQSLPEEQILSEDKTDLPEIDSPEEIKAEEAASQEVDFEESQLAETNPEETIKEENEELEEGFQSADLSDGPLEQESLPAEAETNVATEGSELIDDSMDSYQEPQMDLDDLDAFDDIDLSEAAGEFEPDESDMADFDIDSSVLEDDISEASDIAIEESAELSDENEYDIALEQSEDDWGQGNESAGLIPESISESFDLPDSEPNIDEELVATELDADIAESESFSAEENLSITEESEGDLTASEESIDDLLDEVEASVSELNADLDEIDDGEIDQGESFLSEAESLETEPADIELSDPELSDIDLDSELLADNLTTQIEDVDTEPDPLDEYEERVEEKKTGLRNGVIAAVILILISWGGYQFWQNRQALSWDPTWGSMTKSICGILPCDLKPRRDVAALKLRQRIVEPTENDENKLDIKILLVNNATFAQPYPRITIKFSNQDGKQVAVRQFEVKDYFPEKVGQLIPANTEVHLSFKTDVPHPDALGFEFIFD